jgi:hypothetical protein
LRTSCRSVAIVAKSTLIVASEKRDFGSTRALLPICLLPQGRSIPCLVKLRLDAMQGLFSILEVGRALLVRVEHLRVEHPPI